MFGISRPHTFNNIVNIKDWFPECRKTVNTSIIDAHTFNIIDNPTDIDYY